MHVLGKASPSLIIILVATLLFSQSVTTDTFAATGDIFQRNLKLGDTVSPDVAYLQYILNTNSSTAVSATGAGSPGQLTNYFGAKTESAVKRFQELYRDEILVPAGLPNPTGIVGSMTRTKLNQIAFEKNITTATAIGVSTGSNTTTSTATGGPTDTSPITYAPGTKSFINLFSTYKAFAGQMMSIYGANFHPTKNTIYLGSQKIGIFPSTEDGIKITFTVPTSLLTGTYEIGLINTYGTTSSGDIYLNVIGSDIALITAKLASSTGNIYGSASTLAFTAPQIPTTFSPILEGVFPLKSFNMNDEITIYGNNFATQNTLETNLGNIQIQSTDRRLASFLIGNLPYYMEAFNKYKGQEINVVMNVKNENGKSTTPVTHVIRFPNADTPSINTTIQEFVDPRATSTRKDTNNELFASIYRRDVEAGASSTANSSGSTGVNSSSGNTSGNNTTSQLTTNPGSQATAPLDSVKPQADPALEQLRQISPLHKFISDPLVKGGSSSGSGGSSGAGALGGLGGGSSSGGTTGTGGNSQNLYFGGYITRSIVCTCSVSTYLEVYDKATQSTMKMLYTPPTSSLKEYRNVWTTNVNVIGGLQQGGGDCEVYYGEDCVTEGTADYTIDYIRGIGTSKN